MGWSPQVAVAYYPEGTGHATRMLAIADEPAARGAHVSLAGGGAGQRFVELNGYDTFQPTAVDYTDTYQDESIRDVFTRSLLATAARLSEYVRWLREESPGVLVIDDMFAAMAARRVGGPQCVLKHDLPGLYDDRIERASAGFHTRFQLAATRSFFRLTAWPATGGEPDGVTRVPPVALEGDADGRTAATARDPDVVVFPSAYSDLSRVATHLDRQGFDTLDVGSDAWDPVPSLLPYLRAADPVVCSGYSAVMDAAVAGRVLADLAAKHRQAAGETSPDGRVRRSLARWRGAGTATVALLGAGSLFAWAGLTGSVGRVSGGARSGLVALYGAIATAVARDRTEEQGERAVRLGERLRDLVVVLGLGLLDLLPGGAEVLHPDLGAIVADGEHPGLRADRLDVRTGGRVGLLGEDVELDIVGDVHAARVDLEDEFTTLLVGLGHLDEAVEPARAKDGGVQHVEAVRGRDDGYLTAVLEAIHLGE
jgi:hypothetical protein